MRLYCRIIPGTAKDGGGDHCISIVDHVVPTTLTLLGGCSGATNIERGVTTSSHILVS